jgi:hypothetical protein
VYFVQVFAAYRDKKLSVSLCVFIHPEAAFTDLTSK